MATQKTETPKTEPETRIEKPRFAPGATHLVFEVADRTQSTALAVLQDARSEIRAVLEGGIDLAEKTCASLFRFARKVTARVDDGVGATLTSTEHVIAGGLKSLRETRLAN